eukprot:2286447-Prymnesium_polylepis.1
MKGHLQMGRRATLMLSKIEQHLTGKPEAGVRRSRDPEDAHDAPPPKPVTRVTSGQQAAPNDQSMDEALVPTAGAQQLIEKATEGNASAGGASASDEGKGPQPEREKNNF